GWSEGANYWQWQRADTLNFTGISFGQELDLYFAVMNEKRTDTSINPAGFLAQATTLDGTFLETGTNKLLTDATWYVNTVTYDTWKLGWTGPTPKEMLNPGNPAPYDPTFDPTLMTWTTLATPTGYSNSGSGWWGTGTTVSGIDSNAEWLWTDHNFNWDGNGQTNMDYLTVFHTKITPVPEPASMTLLGLGVLGLLGLRRKKAV
ncbi:MAG: PEP-CTERM sorting domain-containing protein, partial [Candidatus Omnitrophica bacterium]|nr:PEP-CTERM sorting domain-containing protein [Candidatus Omnitrophota bacterium]